MKPASGGLFSCPTYTAPLLPSPATTVFALVRSSYAALCAAALLAACGEKEGGASAQSSGGAPPPPEVGVVSVAPRAIGLVTELPGRLDAVRVAQVRARATGILHKRLFREGS